jgi:FAD/FMN-containing dehydrogenase
MTGSDFGFLSSRHFRGELVLPGDAEYESRRELFNARYDRKPALIVRCSGTSDVVNAVRYGREHDLEIAVRCGGRHMAGFAATDGGMVIDLSLMQAVRVDPHERTAWLQGGLTGGALHPETTIHGLGGITGLLSHTGVSGMLLHGGIGYLSPKLGFGSDTLLELELVTADGEVLHVSAEENPDLFWAVRGAGSNFGVVTWLKIALSPVPRQTTGGLLMYDGARAGEVLRFVRDWDESASDDVMWYIDTFQCPADPSMPEELHDRLAMILSLAHLGEPEDADRELRPLRDFGSPVVDTIDRSTFLDMNGSDDALYARGRQWWDEVELPSLPDRAIDLYVHHCHTMVDAGITGFDFHSIYPRRGAMSRPPAVESCMPRDGRYAVGPMLFWDDAADDDKHEKWSDQMLQSFRDEGLTVDGVYSNCVQRVDPDRLRRSFGDATYRRLASLKAKYDPDNVFHLNHNITPQP